MAFRWRKAIDASSDLPPAFGKRSNNDGKHGALATAKCPPPASNLLDTISDAANAVVDIHPTLHATFTSHSHKTTH
jgi:hypothetical protein